MAQGSCLMLQGSWLTANKKIVAGPPRPRALAPIFLLAISHEPGGMSHELMKYSIIYYRYSIYPAFQKSKSSFKVLKFQNLTIEKLQKTNLHKSLVSSFYCHISISCFLVYIGPITKICKIFVRRIFIICRCPSFPNLFQKNENRSSKFSDLCR